AKLRLRPSTSSCDQLRRRPESIEGTASGHRQPEGPSPLPVLAHVLETALRLLHPFMPFITEELWQGLRRHFPSLKDEALIVAPYPVAREDALDPEAEREMEDVIEVVRAIRNVRAEARVEPARFVEATIQAGAAKGALEGHAAALAALARARPLSILEGGQRPPQDDAVVLVLRGMEVILPRSGLLDLEAERKKLDKEMGVAEAEVGRLEAKLRDEAFVSKAPAAVVERERGRLEEARSKVERLRARRTELD
ncbi:MAG: class I tRNA ligase family protein, partial [Chloroflexota bacterium]|nr:class I tRNA ligase family protein [Chloroflexota bacterium]